MYLFQYYIPIFPHILTIFSPHFLHMFRIFSAYLPHIQQYMKQRSLNDSTGFLSGEAVEAVAGGSFDSTSVTSDAGGWRIPPVYMETTIVSHEHGIKLSPELFKSLTFVSPSLGQLRVKIDVRFELRGAMIHAVPSKQSSVA